MGKLFASENIKAILEERGFHELGLQDGYIRVIKLQDDLGFLYQLAEERDGKIKIFGITDSLEIIDDEMTYEFESLFAIKDEIVPLLEWPTKLKVHLKSYQNQPVFMITLSELDKMRREAHEMAKIYAESSEGKKGIAYQSKISEVILLGEFMYPLEEYRDHANMGL